MEIGGGLKFRNQEIDDVMAVLEKDHASAEDAARAVLRSAFGALLERELWITVVADLPGFTIGYAFFTEGAAVTSIRNNTLGVLSDQRVGILHVKSGDKRAEWVEAQL